MKQLLCALLCALISSCPTHTGGNLFFKNTTTKEITVQLPDVGIKKTIAPDQTEMIMTALPFESNLRIAVATPQSASPYITKISYNPHQHHMMITAQEISKGVKSVIELTLEITNKIRESFLEELP